MGENFLYCFILLGVCKFSNSSDVTLSVDIFKFSIAIFFTTPSSFLLTGICSIICYSLLKFALGEVPLQCKLKNHYWWKFFVLLNRFWSLRGKGISTWLLIFQISLTKLWVRGASRMRAGQGIWILRQGILGHFRPFEVFSGQMACSKTLFLLRAGDVSPSYPL